MNNQAYARFLAFALFVGAGWGHAFAAEPDKQQKRPDILQFTFADAAHGWAVVRTADDKLDVMRTADGGKSWTQATPGGKWQDIAQQVMSDSQADDMYLVDTFALFALDEKRVWVAIGSGLGVKDQRFALIEKSDDGGRHWSASETPFAKDVFLAGIQFVDSMHGFILGSSDPAAGSMNKRLYATADGGGTWHERTSPGGFGSYYTTGFAFASALDGWYTATYHGEPDVPVICTHDGGKTWNVQPLDLPHGFKLGYGNTYAPQFFGKEKKEGMMLVSYRQHEPKENDMLAFYATHDGGKLWTLAGIIPLATSDPGYSFANEQAGWVMVDKQLFSTRDAGRTWTQLKPEGLPADDHSFLARIQFVDEKNGWVLISHNAKLDNIEGELLGTTDGGKTWSEVFKDAP